MIKGRIPSADGLIRLCHVPVPIKSLIREDLPSTCTFYHAGIHHGALMEPKPAGSST
jgi:hypothetical protein